MLLTISERLQLIEPLPTTVSADQAATELKNGGILIDVREPQEFAANPVKNAVNIPRGVLEMKALATIKDANTPLFLHCATSARATLSAEQLMKMGYTNVNVVTCEVPTIQSAFADDQ